MTSPDTPPADYRLRELTDAPESPFQLFKVRAPEPPTTAYEPAPLNFLYLVAGFHLGHMPSVKFGRSPLLYNVLVNRFTALTTDITILLNHGLYFKLFTGDGQPSNDEYMRIKALYGRYNIYKSYPLIHLLNRLYTTMCIIVQHPIPRMQTQTICHLPPEILGTIILMTGFTDMRNLAASCTTLRQVALRWIHLRATFALKYDHGVHHPPARDGQRFIDHISDAIQDSIRPCVNTMWDFLNSPRSRDNTRLLTFDNQWERLIPAHSGASTPSVLNMTLYKELYSAVIIVLKRSRPIHLRLLSIGLTKKLLLQVANNQTLTHLTLHSCTPDKFVVHPNSADVDCGLHLSNLTYLALGFSRSVRENRRCWYILQFCFNLRHFFAYPADTSTTITYPDRTIFTNVPHLHTLTHFHVDCTSSVLSALVEWLQVAATRNSGRVHGSLTHFKLSAKHAMYPEEVAPLLGVLAEFHRGIRVLVLEGVTNATSTIRDISSNFPNLEGLAIIRITHDDQRQPIIGQWELPCHEYAVMLSKLPLLRHFQCNLDYSPFTYGPSAFSAVVYPVHPDPTYDCAANNQYYYFDFHSAYSDDEGCYKEMLDRLEREDSLCDGPAIASPFAAYCPKLESFAIKADATYFSCMIARLATGSFRLYDVIDRPTIGGFQHWNPLMYSSWAYDAAGHV